MNLKSTPLIEEHKKLGARLAPFSDWSMPISYAGIIEEHNWTRTSSSLFDICHMTEFFISGEDSREYLNGLVTVNLDNMSIRSCRYGFMLNEDGGIIDDLIVYKIKDDSWMIVANAGTFERDLNHMKSHFLNGVKLDNISEETGKLDLQGPLSRDILKRFIGPEVESLNYYTFSYFSLLGENCIVSRTGYTGELGYEIYISRKNLRKLWSVILKDERVKPAGLGARDTLRLEMAYPLYGHDITEDTIPEEAGLGQFVDFNKDFIGKEALLRKKAGGINKRLICFMAGSRRSPRHNYKIYCEDEKIGVVTSGSFSPSLDLGIGMGYVKSGYENIGRDLLIKGDNKLEIKASITQKPFYKNGSVKY